MRIHRLKLRAYGPFPGEVDIDFEPLNEAGIFLLNGPTGSGKSSILDAVCFALYGTTSLERPELKSLFAPADSEPLVELDCTIGGTRLHIERSPKWERPKKRGSGTITEQARVLVQRCAADDPATWETKASRNDEAGQYITSLIGLSRKQFTQVMLLPQGHFAQFLNAKSKDREELLKQLFPTDEYRSFQEVLAEEARQAETSAAEIATQLEHLEHDAQMAIERAGIETLLNSQVEDEDKNPQHHREEEGQNRGSTFAQRITLALTTLSSELARTTQQRTRQSQHLESQRSRLATLHQLEENWHRYTELCQRRDELEAQKATHRDDVTQVEGARAARGVLPLIHASERASHQHDQAHRTLLESRAQLIEEGKARALGEIEKNLLLQLTEENLKQSQRLEELIAQAESTSTRLRELAGYEEEIAGLNRNIAESTRKEENQRKKLEATEQQRQQNRKHSEENQKKLESLRPDLVDTDQLAEKVSTAQEILAQVHRAEELKKSLHKAQQQASRDEQARIQAAQATEELQRLRYAQAAHTLARQLVEGSPCPVCGSEEHPAPLPPATSQKIVELQDLEASIEHRNRAETTARTSLNEVTRLKASLSALQEAGVPESDQARAKLQEAELKLKEAKEAHRTAAQLGERETDLQHEYEKLSTRAHEEQLALANINSRKQADTQRLTDIQQQIEPLLSQTATAGRLAAIDRIHQQLHSILRHMSTLHRLDEEARYSRIQLTQALTEHNFATAQAAQEAALDQDALLQLEHRVQKYREQMATITNRLADSAMEDIARRKKEGSTPPSQDELAALNLSIQEGEEERDRLTETSTRLTTASQDLKTIEEAHRQQIARHSQLIDSYRMKRSLADIAAGNSAENTYSMPLTTYVLAAQLEEVTTAATLHLEAMTHGRYHLTHTDQKQNRGKSGLGIAVFDTWHGRSRSPETLSGGETFMASLALALGLADVVQQRHGGIEIATLFVDEGFGSLDDSTLEEVMNTLDSLRERGRVIGLISHVSELKNRIPHHLQITTSPEGSHLVKK